MRAKHVLTLMLVSTLALGLAAAAGFRGYVVVMKDGSWVRASEKPIVEAGDAQIRLKNGLLAVVPESQVDWPQSDRRSRELETLFAVKHNLNPSALPSRPTGIPGALTVGPPSEGGDVAVAPAAAPADPNAGIRTRLAAINMEINNLQGKKANLLDQMSREWNLDKKGKIRDRISGLDERIQTLRREQSRLLLQRIGQ